MSESDNRDSADSADSAEDGQDRDAGESSAGGSSMGLDPDEKPDEEAKEEIEEERRERLDPDNRPAGAEVDNTPRDFNVEHGMFTDSDDYDENEPAPFSDPEDPNNPDNKADSKEQSGDSEGNGSQDSEEESTS